MKVLVYFLPADERHAPGLCEERRIGDDALRVIYYKEDMNFFSFVLFKRKISGFLQDASLYACDISRRLRGDIIWRDGYALAIHHIKQLVFSSIDSAEKKDIVVFSTNPQDIAVFTDIIMTCDVKFLTMSDLAGVYNEIMHEQFGLVGSAVGAAQMQGKTAVIMPGGEIFSAEGAQTIVNLSKSQIPWRCITPLSVQFALPACFSGYKRALTETDALQTALDFFGISYDNTHVISVKFDKET